MNLLATVLPWGHGCLRLRDGIECPAAADRAVAGRPHPGARHAVHRHDRAAGAARHSTRHAAVLRSRAGHRDAGLRQHRRPSTCCVAISWSETVADLPLWLGVLWRVRSARSWLRLRTRIRHKTGCLRGMGARWLRRHPSAIDGARGRHGVASQEAGPSQPTGALQNGPVRRLNDPIYADEHRSSICFFFVRETAKFSMSPHRVTGKENA